MVEPKFEDGVWVCPFCGFKAMSKKVVEMHIQKEHPSEASKKESSGGKPQAKKKESGEKKGRQESRKNRKSEKSKESEKKGGVSKRSFKLGKTEVRLWDYERLDVKDQRAWLMFQSRNYVAGLHGKRVRVKLVSGEVFEGRLKARDPYFVSQIMEGGPIYINKTHILWVRPIQEGD